MNKKHDCRECRAKVFDDCISMLINMYIREEVEGAQMYSRRSAIFPSMIIIFCSYYGLRFFFPHHSLLSFSVLLPIHKKHTQWRNPIAGVHYKNLQFSFYLFLQPVGPTQLNSRLAQHISFRFVSLPKNIVLVAQ